MDVSNVAASAEAEQKNDQEMNPDEDSDVEMEGVDMDADEEEEAGSNADDDDDDNDDAVAALASPSKPENEDEISALETEETHELEEARKERMELMQAERRKAEQTLHGDNKQPASAQERLEYLMAQSDVFAHFLAGKPSIVCILVGYRMLLLALLLIRNIFSIFYRFGVCHQQKWQKRIERQKRSNDRSRRRCAAPQIGRVEASYHSSGPSAFQPVADLQDAPLPARRSQLAHQASRSRY
jgi:hypothetical protein